MSTEPTDFGHLDDIGERLVDAIDRSHARSQRLRRASVTAGIGALFVLGLVGLANLPVDGPTGIETEPAADAADAPNPIPGRDQSVGVPGTGDDGETNSDGTDDRDGDRDPDGVAVGDVTTIPGDPEADKRSGSEATVEGTGPDGSSTTPDDSNTVTAPSTTNPPGAPSSSSSLATPSTSSQSSTATTSAAATCAADNRVSYRVLTDPVVDGQTLIFGWEGMTIKGFGIDGQAAPLVEDRLGLGIEGGRWETAIDMGTEDDDLSERIEIRFDQGQCSVDVTLRRLSPLDGDGSGDIAVLEAIDIGGEVVASLDASRTESEQADETFTLSADEAFVKVRISVRDEVGGFWFSGIAFDHTGAP